MDRIVWEYDSSTNGSMWEDEQIEVTAVADHVLIAVTEEHARDSYNEEFRNSIKLPWPRVRELRDMLSGALDAIATEAVKPVRPCNRAQPEGRQRGCEAHRAASMTVGVTTHVLK